MSRSSVPRERGTTHRHGALLIMNPPHQHDPPTFQQILYADPFVFIGTLLGCGGSVLVVPIFLFLHFSGPETWLETAGSPLPIGEVVLISLFLALLPLLATLPFVFRRTAGIRQMFQESDEIRGKIQFVKETYGITLSVLFIYPYRKEELIRRVAVVKRRRAREILKTGRRSPRRSPRPDPRPRLSRNWQSSIRPCGRLPTSCEPTSRGKRST